MRKFMMLVITALTLVTSSAFASERAETGWQWIDQGAMVVDVRTPSEFNHGHLDNAINYPLSELEQHFATIDKSTAIVLYCRSGNRSEQAYQYLKDQGFSNLHNAGGLNELLKTRP